VIYWFVYSSLCVFSIPRAFWKFAFASTVELEFMVSYLRAKSRPRKTRYKRFFRAGVGWRYTRTVSFLLRAALFNRHARPHVRARIAPVHISASADAGFAGPVRLACSRDLMRDLAVAVLCRKRCDSLPVSTI